MEQYYYQVELKVNDFALPNSRVMIHQPSGGAQGQASDISISAKEILRWRKILNQCSCRQSGQPYEKIEKDTDRDYYMTALEAKEYGLIDEVVERKQTKMGSFREVMAKSKLTQTK